VTDLSPQRASEPGASSDAAHIAAVLSAAQRGPHDPDADLSLMLGELALARTYELDTQAADERSNEPQQPDDEALLDHFLTTLARDARTD